MKYRDIVNYLLGEIDEGNITPGERMPSIRDLCASFDCSKSTAVRAYYELKDIGVVYTIPGSGYYLIGSEKIIEEESNIFDLSGTGLDSDALPYNTFHTALEKSVKIYAGDMFGYTDTQGLVSLRKILMGLLENSQVFTSVKNIFVTTGSQQALNILSRMPFPAGKEDIIMEQPTYQGMVQLLKQNGVKGIGVRRDFDGLDFEDLESQLSKGNIKFFYTVPRFSNPLGLNYSRSEKERLAYLSEKYDTYIIEDDYLADFEYDSRTDPIYSYDINDRVIYVKTFSKLMMPGLRVAVVVIPDRLISDFNEYKYWSDLNTPVLSQGALEIFISSGLFVGHIKKVREIYLKRIECLREVILNHKSSQIKWYIPDKAVFYIGMKIMNNKNSTVIIKKLASENIILSEMENYFLEEFFDQSILRISIARIDCQQIKRVIPELIRIIES